MSFSIIGGLDLEAAVAQAATTPVAPPASAGVGGSGALGDIKVMGTTLVIAGVQNFGSVQVGPDIANQFSVRLQDTLTITVLNAGAMKVGDLVNITGVSGGTSVITSVSGTTLKVALSNSSTWVASGSITDTTISFSTTFSGGVLTDASVGLSPGDSVTTVQGSITLYVSSYANTWVTVNGTLPLAVSPTPYTLNVQSTSAFPASGTFYVNTTNNGVQAVSYTGKTSNTFTGCLGGVGTISSYTTTVVSGFAVGHSVNNTLIGGSAATGVITAVSNTQLTISVLTGAWAGSGSIQDSTATLTTTYSSGPLAPATGTVYSVVKTLTMTIASATNIHLGDSVQDNAGATGVITNILGTSVSIRVTAGTWAGSGTFHDTTTSTTTTYSAGILLGNVLTVTPPSPSNTWSSLVSPNGTSILDTTTSTKSFVGTYTNLNGNITVTANRGLHLKVKGNLLVNGGVIVAAVYGTPGVGGAGGASTTNTPGSSSAYGGAGGQAGTAAIGATYYMTAGGGGGTGGGAGTSGVWGASPYSGGGGGAGLGGAGASRGSIVDSAGGGAGAATGGKGATGFAAGGGNTGGPLGVGGAGGNGAAAVAYGVVDPRPWRTDFDPPYELPRRFGPGAPGGGGGGGGSGGNTLTYTGYAPSMTGGAGGAGGAGGGMLLVEVSGNITINAGSVISAAGYGGNSGFYSSGPFNVTTGYAPYSCGGYGAGGGGGGGGGGSLLIICGGTTTNVVGGTTCLVNGGFGANGFVDIGGAGAAGPSSSSAGYLGGVSGTGGNGESGYFQIATP